MSPIIIAAEEGLSQSILGMTHLNKILPGGPVPGLFMQITAPPGLGAPPHRHAKDTEVFYILSGELTVEGEGVHAVLKSGETCVLPAGGEHTFYNASSGDTRFLAFVSPGVEALDFFTAIDAASRSGPLEPADIIGMGETRGLVFSPPV